MRGVFILLVTLASLAACADSVPGSINRATSPTASASDEVAALPFGLGCAWLAVSDADVTNVLYPDEAAAYWLAAIPHVPGTRLRIDGLFPNARYFSFNVYDPLLRPIDAIADFQIVPEAGNANPYVTPGIAHGESYRAYVEFSTKPELPEPNTIYSGFINAGAAVIPNPALTVLAYRTYVAADGLRGDVRLPVLTLETADGSRELGTLPNCRGPLLPNLGGETLPALGLNPLLAGTDYPEVLSALPYPPAAFPPKSTVFYGLPDSYIGIVNNISPVDVPVEPSQLPLTGGGGFLSNRDNAYTVTAFGRDHGDLFVLRARAPSYRTQPGVSFGTEDVRYWSVCQNEFATQRYVACVRDEQIALDNQGFFTVVVTDAADRPSNAIAVNGIAWLPWGFYPDGLLLVRQLLASDSFAPAIRNVPAGTAPQDIMGDYFPHGVYCTREVFEAAGTHAADIFAACAAAADSQ